MPQFDINLLLSQAAFICIFAATYFSILKVLVPYISFFQKIQSKDLSNFIALNNFLLACNSIVYNLELQLYSCSILNLTIISYLKRTVLSFSLVLL